MQNTVAGAGGTPPRGRPKRVGYARWRTTDERKSATMLMPGAPPNDTLVPMARRNAHKASKPLRCKSSGRNYCLTHVEGPPNRVVVNAQITEEKRPA